VKEAADKLVKIRQRRDLQGQCAVCRDGPSGLVICRGCGTLLHAACLIDVGGCPTIGCDELDPLMGPKPAKSPAARAEEIVKLCLLGMLIVSVAGLFRSVL
jgi:hypothetical protein